MAIERLELKNFTVFEKLDVAWGPGINVLIGENGTGKTHIMKVLYSACQASSSKVSFSQKLVLTMFPDEYKLSRLIRRKQGNQSASIQVTASEEGRRRILSSEFHMKTRKWEAVVKGEEQWEREFGKLGSIFIPAKEILSNSYNLAAAVKKDNVRFDDVYLDIIDSAKVDVLPGRNTDDQNRKLREIERIVKGKVWYDSEKDEFYLKQGNSRWEFNLVAEGIRKMALLWQLVKNGALEKGTVLFWDEPEANLCPVHIPVLAELLLLLQRNGVQIFVATHDYMFAKYLEVKKQEKNHLCFHSFYREGGEVRHEMEECFDGLKSNPIVKAFDRLLDEIYDMGE
ncbi:MAG: AAA family ATPase [Lachnospiraceae bacterium]|nr:AAA family ATPase [Lachnospiraceae bacterium]